MSDPKDGRSKPFHEQSRSGQWKNQQKKRKAEKKKEELDIFPDSSSCSKDEDFGPKSFSTPTKSSEVAFDIPTSSMNLSSNACFPQDMVDPDFCSVESEKQGDVSLTLDQSSKHSSVEFDQSLRSTTRDENISVMSFNASFPADTFNGSLSYDQEEPENPKSLALGLEESFENYSVHEPPIDSDDDDDDDDDNPADDFDPITFDQPSKQALHSESESDGDDDDDEDFFQYCLSLQQDSSEPANDELKEEKNFFRGWTFKHSITLTALTDLCKGLKQVHACFANFPSDARTILKTPTKKIDVIQVPPGEYIHLGLRPQLEFIASLLNEPVECLKLLFNIDGVELYENTTDTLWPILMSTPSVTCLAHKVFPIGLYYGRGKPKDMTPFLQPFIDELLDIIISNNFFIHNQCVRLEIFGFCCDVPARSGLLATIGHTGYYSCFRCVTKGMTLAKRRCFPQVDAALREDSKFRTKQYKDFQPSTKESTPTLQLPGLHFTQSFILDPMHLCFIGVGKGFCTLWFRGGRPHMLKAPLRRLLQNRLDECFYFIPSEFQRKPREITSIAKWKAVEVRLFVLYLGIVVLKGCLDREKYLHFLEFAVAMIIYHSATLCADGGNRHYAKQLLLHFVQSVSELYGENYVSHNCHSLIHLPMDVEFFKDSVENFTLNILGAWDFETFNQVFTKYTRGRSKPLQQISRRLAELFSSDYWRSKYTPKPKSKEIKLVKEHKEGPVAPLFKGRQYKVAEFPDFKLSVNIQGDCTCGTNQGDIIIAQNFILKEGIKYVVGKMFLLKSEFFAEPLVNSKKLGIFKVRKLSREIQIWPLSDINVKYVRLPHGDGDFVTLPLLHSVLPPPSYF